ncbi:hypothetical protein [Bacillus suaedae]|uniref:Heparinase n=1 Tax=Halalkalibacter suaedae TaxID=2822140 RepID=A0A940WWW7_9BACI|nr:hypothetical protein [Bacillus suaedae]MBP3951903.1 hypothetical protein [Bacillus suaedae]
MNQRKISSLLTSTIAQLFSNKEEQDKWFLHLSQNPSTLVEEIRVEAEKQLKESDPVLSHSLFKIFLEKGSRLEYERVYFSKRRRLNTFAIMTLLEPDNQIYRDALQNSIWSICDEYTWCLPAHLGDLKEGRGEDLSLFQDTSHDAISHSIDLFAAETAFALSEVYHLTEHLIDPIVGRRIQEEVYRRVFWPFHHRSFHWEVATHNWSSVCAGSIGAAAIYLIDDKEELSSILARVIQALEYYLQGYYDDGACLEGYGYWQYGFGFFVYFADLLKRKTAGQIDLFQSEKVHQIAMFEQKSFLTKKQIVNFSDAVPESTVFLGLSHYLHQLYPDIQLPEEEIASRYVDDHCSRWAPAIRNLLWVSDELKGKPWQDHSYYLAEAQWFISRVTYRESRYAFATKGGHNAEPHNHNDSGHFILLGDHDVFLQDLGSGEYTKEYFGERRYEFVCNSSEGHSVPIINQQYQGAGKSFAASEFIVVSDDELEEDTIKLDLSRAYDVKSLNQLERRFTWKKQGRPSLQLKDTYTFTEKPESIIERFITPVFDVMEDVKGIYLEGDGNQKLRITYQQDKLAFRKKKMKFSNHQGELQEFIALDFIVKQPEKRCTAEFTFQFLEKG